MLDFLVGRYWAEMTLTWRSPPVICVALEALVEDDATGGSYFMATFNSGVSIDIPDNLRFPWGWNKNSQI